MGGQYAYPCTCSSKHAPEAIGRGGAQLKASGYRHVLGAQRQVKQMKQAE